MTGDRDLFGEERAPALRRVGRRLHLPQSVRALAERMRRDGAPVAEIADALKISESTAWARLAVEFERAMPGGRPAGRPRWSPSAEDRALVVRLTAEFTSVQAIAKRLGCTPPTLQLHCRAELAEGRRLRRAADK